MQACNPYAKSITRACNNSAPMGMAGLFANANASIGIYRIEQGPGPKSCCDDAASLYDPRPTRAQFQSADEVVHLIWSGNAIAATGDKANANNQDWGNIESTQINLTLPKPATEILTGDWVYVRRYGDLEGGRITAIDRHHPTLLRFIVDTAKVVPFPPTLVEVGDWPRDFQV